jgi:predicted oxidoreductase
LAYSIERSAGVLDYCRLKKITIQPWSPIQATREEGSFIDNPHYEELNKVLDRLVKKYLVNKSAIAIAWLLRHPAHMQPIVGASIQHLQELAEASKVTLTKDPSVKRKAMKFPGKYSLLFLLHITCNKHV